MCVIDANILYLTKNNSNICQRSIVKLIRILFLLVQLQCKNQNGLTMKVVLLITKLYNNTIVATPTKRTKIVQLCVQKHTLKKVQLAISLCNGLPHHVCQDSHRKAIIVYLVYRCNVGFIRVKFFGNKE